MNLRHTSALALVGWYLMTPPISTSGSLNTDGPLSAWVEDSAHDSASACEQMKAEMLYATAAARSLFPDSAENKHGRATLALNNDRYLNARCIATDDPRLKEK